MIRFSKIFAGLIVIGVVVVMSLRGAITRPILFPAPRFKFTPELPGGRLVTTATERTAYGYYAKGGKKLVVFFHGNGEVMGSMQDLATIMLKENCSVLMTEYPGYGYASDYKTTEAHIYEDTAALLQLMREKYGHAAADTVLWGFSLGTGVAVEMAARKLGERVILMAPFTSAGDTAAHHFFFAARWLIIDDFNNKAKAASVGSPTLIVHGERDSIIPVRMGKELAGVFPKVTFIPVPDADHNDLLGKIDATLWRRIISFAQAYQ